MLRHHLVDLGLRERRQLDIDLPQNTRALDDDPEHARLFRRIEDLLEVLDVSFEGAVPVDSHDAVAGLEIGAPRGTIVDDRLHGDSRIQLFDLRAEVAAAARKLPDGLLALSR